MTYGLMDIERTKGAVMVAEIPIYSVSLRSKFKQGVYRRSDGSLVVILVACRNITMTGFYQRLYDIAHEKPSRTWWFRATNNPKEHLELDTLVSKNHVDGYYEDGLSVSEHPYYQKVLGYKYIYVVTGELVGTGSDGEPVIQNAKALTKPAKTLPKEWREKYKQESKRNVEKYGITEKEMDELFRLNPVKVNERVITISNDSEIGEDLTFLFGFV